jgi:integrase
LAGAAALPKGAFLAMRPGPSFNGAKQMAAVLPLRQSPKWAKRENQPPVRRPNQASRTREYLTPDEVERMIIAARQACGRLAERDALLIMMAYRHGLRASELIALRWDQMISRPARFTSQASSTARPRHVRRAARSFAPCAPESASRAMQHHTCSRRCAAAR